MRAHRHRRVRDVATAFTDCVAPPGQCVPAAHGGIRQIEACRCTAVRVINIRFNDQEIGPWKGGEGGNTNHQ